jgi:ribosomal protein L24E
MEKSNQAQQNKRRATCPYCGRRVTLTGTGKLWAHSDPATGKRCVRTSTN